MFKLLRDKWLILKEISHVLSIPYKATIDLQRQSLTLSDVYGIWLSMQLHLNACSEKSNYQTGLVQLLVSSLNIRKECIFRNPFMSAALFLDPRFRMKIIRDEDKVIEAKETLKKVWRRLLVNRNDDADELVTETTISRNDSTATDDISFEYDEENELHKYLNGDSINHANAPPSNRTSNTSEIDIEHLLDNFDPPPMKSKENVLHFWETIENEEKELFQLAMIIISIPPTEVQIERDFSKLNFVFSDRRCSLSEDMLEDIMIINFNPELFYEVKSEERCAMKTSFND